jgi:hypothetical protein
MQKQYAKPYLGALHLDTAVTPFAIQIADKHDQIILMMYPSGLPHLVEGACGFRHLLEGDWDVTSIRRMMSQMICGKPRLNTISWDEAVA